MTDTASAAPSERAQFEAWARDKARLATHMLEKDKRSGGYLFKHTSDMWKGWQGARAQPTPPAVVEPPHQPKRTVTYVCPVCAASLERQE